MPPPAQTLLGVSVWIRQEGRVGQRYKAPPVPTSVPPPRPPPSRSLASPPLGTPGASPPGPLHWPDAPPGGPSRPSSPSTVPPSPRGVPSVLLIRQASSFHTQLCNGRFAPPTPLPVTGIQTRQCWEAGQWSDMVRPRRWHPREGDRRPHTGTISLPRGDVASS